MSDSIELTTQDSGFFYRGMAVGMGDERYVVTSIDSRTSIRLLTWWEWKQRRIPWALVAAMATAYAALIAWSLA